MSEIIGSKSDLAIEESFRTLRTNILTKYKNIKSIAVTSCMGREGKTYVAAKLADHFNDLDKKTVYINGDMRKSSSKKGDVLGLSEYLKKPSDLNRLMQQSGTGSLFEIENYEKSMEALELLNSPAWLSLMEQINEEMDYIIIDTPSIGEVSDAIVIANKCDGILLVVEPHIASTKLVKSTLEQLKESGCNVLGVVMNKYQNN